MPVNQYGEDYAGVNGWLLALVTIYINGYALYLRIPATLPCLLLAAPYCCIACLGFGTRRLRIALLRDARKACFRTPQIKRSK